MQISIRIYPLLIVCSVLGFRKGLLNSLSRGLFLMDFIALLKHLALDYGLGIGIFLFEGFNQVSEFMCLFLLFCFGFKILYSDGVFKGFVRFLSCFRVKPWELTNVVCSKSVLAGKYLLWVLIKPLNLNLIDKMEEKKSIHRLNPCTDSDEKANTDCDEDSDADNCEEDDEFDVSRLRNLVKIERHRANEACEELAKERGASASAAEEAMAMILRLQNEKSSIEMELNQFKRLAEEKQIHDQGVIRSLQWLVLRNESERGLLENPLKKMYEFDDSGDGEESSFNGSIWEDLENVLYSSRDANFSPE
ncbi:hypothetical protein ABFS83_02G051700 [Erythranthe nasuta]